MRGLNTLNTAAGNIALGDVEFVKRGERVMITGADSVATSVLNVTFAGQNVFSGPLPIEDGTDFAPLWTKALTIFTAQRDSNMIANLSGATGARVNFLVLAPGETYLS